MVSGSSTRVAAATTSAWLSTSPGRTGAGAGAPDLAWPQEGRTGARKNEMVRCGITGCRCSMWEGGQIRCESLVRRRGPSFQDMWAEATAHTFRPVTRRCIGPDQGDLHSRSSSPCGHAVQAFRPTRPTAQWPYVPMRPQPSPAFAPTHPQFSTTVRPLRPPPSSPSPSPGPPTCLPAPCLRPAALARQGPRPARARPHLLLLPALPPRPAASLGSPLPAAPLLLPQPLPPRPRAPPTRGSPATPPPLAPPPSCPGNCTQVKEQPRVRR